VFEQTTQDLTSEKFQKNFKALNADIQFNVKVDDKQIQLA